MKNKLVYVVWVICTVICLAVPGWASEIPEEAQLHFDRGMAAVEMARTPEDYVPAVDEFKKARALAPDWPDVYYNLGLIQEKAGRYRDAADSLRRYLQLVPDSPDAAAIRTLANKAEFKAEQVITDEDAVNIFASLSGSSQWLLRGVTPDDPVAPDKLRGMRISGKLGLEVVITYWKDANDIQKSSSLLYAVPQGKTLSFTTVYYLCNSSVQNDRCPDVSEYKLEIISKRNVKMSRKRFLPEIRNVGRAEILNNSYEFVRK